MGSRSSTASTNTTKDFVTNNVDNRVSDGDIGGNINVNLSDISTNQGAALGAGIGGGSDGGGAGPGGSSSGVNLAITTSDFGALDAASEISDRAFEFSEQTALQLGATTAGAISTAESIADQANALASEATRDEAARTQQFLIVGGVMVALGLVFVLSRGRK